MENGNQVLLYDLKRLMSIRYPRFATEIANANISYHTGLKFKTACTDGKNIYVDPDFIAKLSEEDRLFVIAHELMHVKFQHPQRIKINPDITDLELWNQACDAVTNANLVEDGFVLKQGYVNRPEAINFSAEEFYHILLKEKSQNKSNEGKDSKGEKTENKGSVSPTGDSDHSVWGDSLPDMQNDANNIKPKKTKNEPAQYDEKSEFEANRQEKDSRLSNMFAGMKTQVQRASDYGLAKTPKIVDWRLVLKRRFDGENDRWTQRKGIEENGYAYRLEDYDDDENESVAEVMLDTSPSVPESLLRAFLRQLKPILKESKMKVGCFSDGFYGFTEIKKDSDIDSFKVVRGSGTSFNNAVRYFSKDPRVNKIVFTDGRGAMSLDFQYLEDVLWIVFDEHSSFVPTKGTVIKISEEQFKEMSLLDDSKTM